MHRISSEPSLYSILNELERYGTTAYEEPDLVGIKFGGEWTPEQKTELRTYLKERYTVYAGLSM